MIPLWTRYNILTQQSIPNNKLNTWWHLNDLWYDTFTTHTDTYEYIRTRIDTYGHIWIHVCWHIRNLSAWTDGWQYHDPTVNVTNCVQNNTTKESTWLEYLNVSSRRVVKMRKRTVLQFCNGITSTRKRSYLTQMIPLWTRKQPYVTQMILETKAQLRCGPTRELLSV